MTSRGSEFRPKYAIAGAGAVARSLIGRLPHLREDVGPVIGVSFRVASRIANGMRAGRPIRDGAELNPFRIVLFHSPADHTAGLMQALLAEEIEWQGKALVICDCEVGEEWLAQLRARGASVAAAREFGLTGYIAIDGEGPALTAVHRIARDLDLKAVEVPNGAEACFAAALTFAAGAFTPLIDRVAALLRHAGVREADAPRLAAALFQKTAGDYVHSGRQSWRWHAQSPDIIRVEAEIAAANCIEGTATGDALRSLILLGLSVFDKHEAAALALRQRDSQKPGEEA